MKTLQIRNIRSFVLAAALLGTGSLSAVVPVFTEDFSDNDISDWTAGCERVNSVSGDPAIDDFCSAPVAAGGVVQLGAHGSCFQDPFDGVASTLTKTINLPNGTYILSYTVSHSTTHYDFCEGGTGGDSGILVNGALISSASCTVNNCGTCTVPTGTVCGSFTVTGGSVELKLRTNSGDCADSTGVFDNITITSGRGGCANPSIDVTDLAVTCGDNPCVQTGSFDIINVSDDPRTVTVESFTGSIVFIGQGGVKTACGTTVIQTVPPFPFSIGPGLTQTVTYTLTCTDCPPEASEAREIQNFVDVHLDGRDKAFRASGSCFPVGE